MATSSNPSSPLSSDRVRADAPPVSSYAATPLQPSLTLKINGKALYTTKGAAREYGRIGCNFYVGCPHGCAYCYLKRGAPSKYLGGTKVQLKKCFKDEDDAAAIFKKELDRWLDPCKKYGIFLSFTTDPMIEETSSLTVAAIIYAIAHDVPVYILTKHATFIYDDLVMDWLHTINEIHRNRIHFGFTLTGRDDMEPYASHNQDRIMAMRRMYLMGYSTFASIEPVIDWQSAKDVIGKSLPWCQHYKIGLRSGVKKDYYNPKESFYAVSEIIGMASKRERTVYLKESTRKLLCQCLSPEVMDQLLSKTVDMDGVKIPLHVRAGDDGTAIIPL